MNQIYENEGNPIPVPMDYVLGDKMEGSINYLLLGLRFAIKKIVKEAVEEVILEQNFKAVDEERTITAKELCDRWNISSNTLRTWEIDKRISPLPLNGRTKIYSMTNHIRCREPPFVILIIPNSSNLIIVIKPNRLLTHFT